MSTMSASMTPFLYQGPNDNYDALRSRFVNQKLKDIEAPAAVIDVAVVRRNCQLMLDATKTLDVSFRAHIKTSKTLEATKLQVGESGPIKLVVSTIAELEHILPWLQECIKQGRDDINVLYGVPVAPSILSRLAKLAHVLGASKYISLMIDHPTTIDLIEQNHDQFPGPVLVYLKVDTGYNRAGVAPNSAMLTSIHQKLSTTSVSLLGLYSHLGHSYAFSTPLESLQGLLTEFETLHKVAQSHFAHTPIHLSVGATPTATAAQVLTSELAKPEDSATAQRWSALKNSDVQLEIHAGVYPFLDLQQLATRARTRDLDYANIGLRILVEVASLYPERSKTEALVAAGSLALGREPCKSYPGWGVVSPWSSLHGSEGHYSPEQGNGWIVGRISQEHGILSHEGDRNSMRKLQIGEKLLVWPNHACIAGAGFGWYIVVDSDLDGGEVVKDVWVRCRGW